MIELSTDKPLKRAIPGTSIYMELFGGHVTFKVKGSRREGCTVNWMLLLRSAVPHVPENAPASLERNALAYLRWVAEKRDKRKAKKDGADKTA